MTTKTETEQNTRDIERNRENIVKIEAKQDRMEKEHTEERIEQSAFKATIETQAKTIKEDVNSIKKLAAIITVSILLSLFAAVAKGAGVFGFIFLVTHY